MLKNKLVLFLLIFFLFFSFVFSTFADETEEVLFSVNKYIYSVGGQPFKLDVAPVYDNFTNHFLIPLRAFSELLKYSIDWSDAERKATLMKKGLSIEIYAGSHSYLFDGKEETLELTIKNGRILIDENSVSKIFNIDFNITNLKRDIKFLVPRSEILIIAMDFTLKDTEGNIFNLYETLDRKDVNLVILNFWATYCPICLKELPQFVSLYNDYKDKGVLVVGINTDTSSTEEMREQIVKKYGVNYPVLLDLNSEVYDLYSVSGVPNLFVINKDREVILHHLGSSSSYFSYLRTYIDKYLSEIKN
jgi:peroxiredoxin